MPVIISEERFKSLYDQLWEKYLELAEKFPEDQKFKKLGRMIKLSKQAYRRDSVYAVKYLNHFEQVLVSYNEERRALIVRFIELMQKVILHKKIGSNS